MAKIQRMHGKSRTCEKSFWFFNGGNFFIFELIQLQLEEFCCRCVIVETAFWHCQTLLQKGIPLLLDCRHIIKTSLLNRQYCQRWLIQFCHLADFFSCVLLKCYEWERASKNSFEILPFTLRLSVSLDCLWWLGDNVVDDYDRLDQTFLRRTVIGL